MICEFSRSFFEYFILTFILTLEAPKRVIYGQSHQASKVPVLGRLLHSQRWSSAQTVDQDNKSRQSDADCLGVGAGGAAGATRDGHHDATTEDSERHRRASCG